MREVSGSNEVSATERIMGITGGKWLQRKCRAWPQCCGACEETVREWVQVLPFFSFLPFCIPYGDIFNTSGTLAHILCWYFVILEMMRTTYTNGVFLKVQTLSPDCLHTRRCWRGKSAGLIILARPERGLLILGCLPGNRLVAVKGIYFD